jgi:hypothetical protein
LGAVGALVLWWLAYRLLQPAADFVTYRLLSIERGTHLASSVSFFLFEVPKVLMLLVLVVFGVGIVRTFFTPERTRQILAGKREAVGNVLAAALGTVLAFMMCVIGLSLPETIVLRKVLRWPLIAVFVGVVAAGILIVGFVFNLVF